MTLEDLAKMSKISGVIGSDKAKASKTERAATLTVGSKRICLHLLNVFGYFLKISNYHVTDLCAISDIWHA